MKFDTDNQSNFARLVRSLLKDSPHGIQFIEQLKKRVNPLVLSHEDIAKHDNIPRQLENKMESMGIALKDARNPIVRVARTIWYEDATKPELEAFMDSYKSHPYASRVMPDDIMFSHNLHQNQGDPKPSEDREAAGTEDHTATSPNNPVVDSGEQTRFNLEDGNEPNILPQLETTSNSKQMPVQSEILVEDDEITEAPLKRVKHPKQLQHQSQNWSPFKDELKLDDLFKAISAMNTRFDSVLDETIKRMNTFFDERLHDVNRKIDDAMHKKSVEIRRLSQDSDTRFRRMERKLGTEQPLVNVKIPPSEGPRAHSSHRQQRDSGGQSTFKT
ncbi:hypothetical protein BWQ96_00049 [Gracilariopsis chorda]|uniref:Uncharacterized protein n=1 Tax=Gracilariopsis chorda TaxID=448386 RepID=A0A2V3J658_9FLOR|nr:hypothetical protein BWQ96_00049 [Gracilariopsis chorda]|eukprot:PXF49889.1 hypothetical protein BWQ96_00049 [Gracilariopsis chorda]